MFAARGQVEEVGAAASQPGPWTVGPSGAKFGENIFGQAQTEDIAPHAATEVIETRVAGPVYCNSLSSGNKRVAQTPAFSTPVSSVVIVSVSFDAETNQNGTWDTSYHLRVSSLSGAWQSVGDSRNIGGSRSRYTTSVTFDAPVGVDLFAEFSAGYNLGSASTTVWNVELRVEIIKL